jgi:hypothetical protein
MGDAHLVAHGVPDGRAALTDRQVRAVHVGQANDVCAKIQIQECLLCLARAIARVVEAAEHAQERPLIWSEREYTGVKGQLEARVAIHVRDGGAEREGHLEELVEVLPCKGVRVGVDDALGAKETVEGPEVKLGVLVDEAVADALVVVGWQDALDLEELPSCYAYDVKRSGGETADVEEDALGGGADGSERITERRCGHGVQVVVERGHDRSRGGIRRICRRHPCGEMRFPAGGRDIRSERSPLLHWGDSRLGLFFQPSLMFSQVQKSCEIKNKKAAVKAVASHLKRHRVTGSGSMRMMEKRMKSRAVHVKYTVAWIGPAGCLCVKRTAPNGRVG